MTLPGWASWLHKWLALVVGVQILLWVVSGLVFALYPIEQVRSEHRVAEHAAPALETAALLSPKDVTSLLRAPPVKLTYEHDVRGRAVAIAEFADGRPSLIDLHERRVVSPLTEAAAVEVARSAIANAPNVRSAHLMTAESAEYRGALPAWRIAFADREGLAVYVAADTGRVTARRSDLWRVYDALWALHIMDWRDHENFNNGFLIVAAVTSLIVVLAGFILFPYRLRFGKR